jgi:hypothetical protein
MVIAAQEPRERIPALLSPARIEEPPLCARGLFEVMNAPRDTHVIRQAFCTQAGIVELTNFFKLELSVLNAPQF